MNFGDLDYTSSWPPARGGTSPSNYALEESRMRPPLDGSITKGSSDADERRKRQNRIAQRNHRKSTMAGSSCLYVDVPTGKNTQMKIDRLDGLENALSAQGALGDPAASGEAPGFDYCNVDLSQALQLGGANANNESSGPVMTEAPQRGQSWNKQHQSVQPQNGHSSNSQSSASGDNDCSSCSIASAHRAVRAQSQEWRPANTHTDGAEPQRSSQSRWRASLSSTSPHISDSSLPGSYGHTALHKAAVNGHFGTVKTMLAHGVHAAAVDGRGRTVLHAAAECGHTAMVLFLLEQGQCIDGKDFDGSTPLYLAAANGREETVGLLMEKGADAGIWSD